MSEWIDVGSFDELERAGHVLAKVGNREIGVVLGRDGAPRAVRNRCPHHGAPLCLGQVLERIGGAPGRYALSGEAVLRCPWHGWEFDLDTGRCLDEASMRAAVYPAKVEDGRVLVDA